MRGRREPTGILAASLRSEPAFEAKGSASTAYVKGDASACEGPEANRRGIAIAGQEPLAFFFRCIRFVYILSSVRKTLE